MKILLWGLIIFIDSFLLHLAIWKIRLPNKQTNTLLILFFGNLFFFLGLIFSFGLLSPANSRFFPSTLPEILHIGLLFSSLTLAYIITYSAIEVDSPSLSMVLAIDKAGKEGLEKKILETTLTDDFLVIPRVNDLLRDKLIYKDNDKFKLTPKGKSFVSIFIFWRKLMQAQTGG